jgi:hypothetical protein
MKPGKGTHGNSLVQLKQPAATIPMANEFDIVCEMYRRGREEGGVIVDTTRVNNGVSNIQIAR